MTRGRTGILLKVVLSTTTLPPLIERQESERSCICVLGVSNQESERSCICVLGVSNQESEWSCICVLDVMYLCVRSINVASFYDFASRFENYVVIFVFHLITYI